MSIAITGASGFLGSYLVPKLHSRKTEVLVALTRRLPSEATEGLERMIWVHGDLGSVDDCRRLVESASTVIHLAHASTPITSDRNWPADVQLNLIPTLNLVQAIRDAGGRPHVVYASSGGAVYRLPSARKPVRETSACMPLSSYGVIKLAVEQYLRAAARQGWLTTTALRIGNPYGSLLPMERTQGIIGVALNRMIHGLPIRVFGNPNNIRDYVHLDDVARMFDRVLHRPRGFEVFNVGSGVGYSVREILALLGELTGLLVTSEYVSVPEAAGALPSWIVLDVSKARNVLGWTPSIDFRDGLRLLCHQALCTPPT